MVDLTFQGTPGWYGTKELAQRAEENSRIPFQRYNERRIAPFSGQQTLGFNIAEREATNPEYQQNYGEAIGTVRNATGQNILPQLQPYLTQATQNPTINAQQYMNPYQDQVVNRIGTLASRNLTENILPKVRDSFIGAGQYGSTGHQDLTGRAIRDTQEAVAGAQGQALQGGYNTAMNTAVGQQERNLQTGQLLGSSQENQIRRQLAGAEGLQALSQGQQTQGQRTAGILSQLGGQQQQQNQNELATQYQDWQNEMNYPHEQVKRFSEIQRGLPATNFQQYTASNPVTVPTASPWTQGAGLVAGLGGAFNQRPGFAKGGYVMNTVKKLPRPSVKHLRHYASGGATPQGPIQRGVNDALDTAELRHMREEAINLSKPQVDPFWAAISRAGFNVAANRQPGVLAAIGEGANAGLNEYQSQLSSQDNRGLQSAKIMNLIDATRRMQSENDRKYELETEQFGQKKKEFEMSHGLEASRVGMMKSKEAREAEEYEGKKGLIEGPGNMLYNLNKDEEGNRIATPLKGLLEVKSKKELASENALYKKSNESAVEEARKSLSNLPALKSNLNSLKGLANKLDTGATSGRIAKMSSTAGSLVGVGKAEDIDNFDALTNQLVLDLGNQLKGSQIALGKLKIIENSKPQLNKVKGANLEIIKHMEDLAKLSEEKSRFIMKSLKSDVNAIEAEDAFNKYADAKLEFEESGKKFPNKPEDFLEANEFESTVGQAREASPELESMSEEELRRIAGE